MLLLHAIDRFEKEPLRLLAAGAVLGAIATPILSVAVLLAMGRGPNLPLGYATGAAPDPIARIVEQVVAGALVLLLVRALADEFDDALDGIVYGGAIGAGLGAAETFLFVAGGTGQLDPGTIAALLIAGLNQAFYGAVMGGIVGAVHRWESSPRRWIVIGLGVATAAFLSAFHDTLPSMLARLVDRPDGATGAATRLVDAVINVLALAAIAGAVAAAWRREARIVRVYLEPEIPGGLASQEDVDRLTSLRGRFGRQLRTLRSGGLRQLQAVRRLEAAQGELAFQKWRTHVRRGARPDGTGDALRERIRKLQADVATHSRAHR
ncbi:MAG: PrsW family glutamic-type intramembrane protease [Candidatus Limnocylindrales bacterium]